MIICAPTSHRRVTSRKGGRDVVELSPAAEPDGDDEEEDEEEDDDQADPHPH